MFVFFFCMATVMQEANFMTERRRFRLNCMSLTCVTRRMIDLYAGMVLRGKLFFQTEAKGDPASAKNMVSTFLNSSSLTGLET